ncbi:MBL fold metallo-hydrolase [Waterburya agarophytonicola K14]|uniref:MBL fold metallo-hydrolase n=1 Tax=Waterburya agarophytonicola KI4 TaxID=2874699 RepID=A0A964BSP1_9CYAN|nr:MBL fold metallo-hydrolase [Waterburya agarophytonicola]MCC0179028.1 MBL fold metallo-hydrolase [Waterburya agarophytonicola KI4]
MKRRQLIRYGGISLATAIATNLVPHQPSFAEDATQSVTIQYLGHTCFLFKGSGLTVLVNPYQSAGCTAGYTLPDVQPDVVLISSFLLDEGAIDAVPGNPQIFTEKGSHQVEGIKFKGFSLPHDREGGKRFGTNVAWRWTQGGVDLLHLGGAAASLATEDKILLSGSDIVFLPVGGGMKAYNPTEAKQVVKVLHPKMIIPTHYRTSASSKENCDLTSVDEFLSLVQDMEIARVGSDRIAVKPADLANRSNTLVRIFDYTS